MSRIHIRCGHLFTGQDLNAASNRTIVVEGERITFVGPSAGAPAPSPTDEIVDHRDRFVLPGLIDLHTHLSYGNALGQEDIDLYASMEFRALRALAASQAMLRAGFTAIMDPATSGLVAPAVRDAIDCGLFVGPRITASGPALTTRQGLYDWYPSWIGAPPTSTGVLVRNRDEAIEEIRRQVKEGVDLIKLAMDGIQGDKQKGLYAAFTQDETSAMVSEAHRLGRRVGVHARGTEGALYAACAGADIIFHASAIDDAGIEAALKNGCRICPSLTLLANNIQFSQPSDASHAWWPEMQSRELSQAVASLTRARAAGVPFLSGSESGFAVTPYGDWAAKELELAVSLLGFTPAEALRTATVVNAELTRDASEIGAIETGRRADLLVVDGDPIADIALLQNPRLIVEVRLGGRLIDLPAPLASSRHPRELAQGMWGRLYTRAHVQTIAVRPLSRSLSAD